MFTHPQLSAVARAAHALVEGEGQGFTQYATSAPRARYVVGGFLPSRMYPVGEAVARIKADALAASRTPLGLAAQTLGCWEDGGVVYVDFGTVTDDYDHARMLARKRDELAFYDTLTGESIRVSTESRHARDSR